MFFNHRGILKKILAWRIIFRKNLTNVDSLWYDITILVPTQVSKLLYNSIQT